MATESSMVFIVDDDPLIRASIQGLLKSASLQSERFETAEQFLVVKRLGKKFRGAQLHRFHRLRNIAVSRDKNYGNLKTRGLKLCLKIEAAHAR